MFIVAKTEVVVSLSSYFFESRTRLDSAAAMKNNSIEQDTVWYSCGIFMNRILQTVKSIQAFTDKKNFLTSQNSTRSKIKGKNSDMYSKGREVRA